ncbi:hypothetical protein P3X46_029342 [Hevea brasiliensis]|uniref:Pentacotripeptide-repeat region of PRORP domain-containing protein n=1 Tax=Hevea brasiliensis TaxID=3981 RepID=A0ABQ9KUV2_HEVBR|nr:hypothetical protein P3X46_029342 [Hevea brasiliensis]
MASRNDNGASFDISCLLDTLSEGVVDDTKQHSSFLFKEYDALGKSYLSAGMFDEAIDALFQMGRRGLVPHIFTCNFLMNRLIQNGKVDMALAIYKQLKRMGLSLNDFAYATVIKAFCLKGSLEEAADVFNDIEEDGVTGIYFTYIAYIGLCVNQKSDLGYQVLQAWKSANIPLDTYFYAVAIRGFCNEMKLDKAEGVLLDMEKEG